jgi:putative methionine-R-sulfoxide reductase with GAF domain
MNETLRELAQAVDSERERGVRAQDAAEIVRSARGYRWVGIYDAGDEEFALIGFTGESPPADPRFPLDRGLSGEAVRTRSTAVASTGSEAIVPVLGAESGIVIGTLDAKSGAHALSDEDVSFLEACAAALRPLYD